MVHLCLKAFRAKNANTIVDDAKTKKHAVNAIHHTAYTTETAMKRVQKERTMLTENARSVLKDA